ncbi:hypothetical protein XENOCAPTIV_001144 [Xenoophorus captivus]|uniref:RNA helicase n=1 Tax=Xenoophorus captivus TaxID=1517983 RepID=A0ABV0RNT0_9TELE
MAQTITSFSIVEVAKPNIGESWPARVRADVTINLNVQDHIKHEWEGLRKHDVCFLITVRPMLLYGTRFDRRQPFLDQTGLVYVRGCEVQGMLDEKGRVIEEDWLHDIILGYGDPGSAHYSKMPNQISTLDFNDTFLNTIQFTPTQIEAIRAGMQPGLTMVVGPPGTGKTDVAVQIISNLYHNFPEQRTLILFEKIMALDIDERHLLRLGHGEEELETEKDFSR